ncbi:hypothetical protein J2741_001847 [Methanolinea mesophila]|uniref:hypothetical protein n=1 Tax=Methanolinea mesophila TaxID=547055 RepID=UPI001AE4F084|nr:hypothetical protein [Methanolinea mesophila]
MIQRSGLVWDTNLMFHRYIEDCGVSCEHVTPHMLAAPFFRGRYVTLVIPTGFGNPSYSRLLPALRASSGRIRRFVENGGNLLVFGAAEDKNEPYDWLPFRVVYRHQYQARAVEVEPAHPCAGIIADFDSESIECDGFFPEHEGEVVAHSGGLPVAISRRVGEGSVLVTCIHEYPSRRFLSYFCSAEGETLF